MTGGSGLVIGGSSSVVQGISFRNFPGVALDLQGANSFIAGNHFGVNETATACTPRTGMVGLSVGFSATNSVIGGNSANPADRNVFGCMQSGIQVFGSDAEINNNLIGTGAGGVALANGTGVSVTSSGFSPGIYIGLPVLGLGNVIARNTGAGVTVGSNRNSVFVQGNDIFLNGGLGIDLGNNGPTPNAPNLSPNFAQPNGGQNFPLVTFVRYDSANTYIDWSLNGFANASLGIDFFSNPRGWGSTRARVGWAPPTARRTPPAMPRDRSRSPASS